MSELHFDVVGADGPKRYFRSIAAERLAHAYLFAGPAGVGKKTFARRLAQSLLCTAPKSGVLGYDGTCASCKLFGAESARHPDFLEHEGVLKIGDPDAATGFHHDDELSARDLVRQLALQSYSGGLRIALLGDIDFATPAAANALLKLLEEPPRGVVLFLTSSSPGRLLPTIRSRLVDISFSLLSKAAVATVLERLHVARADADLAASLSGGSVGRALATLEGEEESLRAHVVRWFFESVAGKSPEGTWATRETLDEGLETIKLLVRDWIVAGGGDGVALVSIDCADRLRKLKPIDPRVAVALLGKIDDAQRLARTNVSAALVGEFVRMALTSTL